MKNTCVVGKNSDSLAQQANVLQYSLGEQNKVNLITDSDPNPLKLPCLGSSHQDISIFHT